MAKTTLNKKKILFISKLDIKLRNKHVKLYVWSTTLSGAEYWILRKVDQKCLESV